MNIRSCFKQTLLLVSTEPNYLAQMRHTTGNMPLLCFLTLCLAVSLGIINCAEFTFDIHKIAKQKTELRCENGTTIIHHRVCKTIVTNYYINNDVCQLVNGHCFYHRFVIDYFYLKIYNN